MPMAEPSLLSNHEMHKRKVRSVSSSIDTSAPSSMRLPHLRRNLKQQKMEEDRWQEIERSNHNLVRRMKAIMQGSAAGVSPRLPIEDTFRPLSLNYRVRKARERKIQSENRLIFRKLCDSKSNYSREKTMPTHFQPHFGPHIPPLNLKPPGSTSSISPRARKLKQDDLSSLSSRSARVSRVKQHQDAVVSPRLLKPIPLSNDSSSKALAGDELMDEISMVTAQTALPSQKTLTSPSIVMTTQSKNNAPSLFFKATVANKKPLARAALRVVNGGYAVATARASAPPRALFMEEEEEDTLFLEIEFYVPERAANYSTIVALGAAANWLGVDRSLLIVQEPPRQPKKRASQARRRSSMLRKSDSTLRQQQEEAQASRQELLETLLKCYDVDEEELRLTRPAREVKAEMVALATSRAVGAFSEVVAQCLLTKGMDHFLTDCKTRRDDANVAAATARQQLFLQEKKRRNSKPIIKKKENLPRRAQAVVKEALGEDMTAEAFSYLLSEEPSEEVDLLFATLTQAGDDQEAINNAVLVDFVDHGLFETLDRRIALPASEHRSTAATAGDPEEIYEDEFEEEAGAPAPAPSGVWFSGATTTQQKAPRKPPVAKTKTTPRRDVEPAGSREVYMSNDSVIPKPKRAFTKKRVVEKVVLSEAAAENIRRQMKTSMYGTTPLEAFSRFDKSGDGHLDKFELRKIVRKHLRIVDVEEAEIDLLYESLDVDKSGSVDIEELAYFIEHGLHKAHMRREEQEEEDEGGDLASYLAKQRRDSKSGVYVNPPEAKAPREEDFEPPPQDDELSIPEAPALRMLNDDAPLCQWLLVLRKRVSPCVIALVSASPGERTACILVDEKDSILVVYFDSEEFLDCLSPKLSVEYRNSRARGEPHHRAIATSDCALALLSSTQVTQHTNNIAIKSVSSLAASH